MMNLPQKILKLILIVFLLVVGITAYNYIFSPLHITVTGVGEVTAPVDTAEITVTLAESEVDTTAVTSLLQNQVTSIKNFLKKNGVEENLIVENKPRVLPLSPQDLRSAGVRAIQILNIKLNDLSKLSLITSQLKQFGADYVSQPEMKVTDKEAWETKAEEAALQNAETKATILMKKYRKSFKKLSGISFTDYSTFNNSLSPITDQNTKVTDFQIGQLSNQNIVKNLLVTYKMW